MSDITKKIRNDLNLMSPSDGTPVGAQFDMTTHLARKLAQDRQIGATSEAALYDGGDLTHDLRNYLRDVPD